MPKAARKGAKNRNAIQRIECKPDDLDEVRQAAEEVNPPLNPREIGEGDGVYCPSPEALQAMTAAFRRQQKVFKSERHCALGLLPKDYYAKVEARARQELMKKASQNETKPRIPR